MFRSDYDTVKTYNRKISIVTRAPRMIREVTLSCFSLGFGLLHHAFHEQVEGMRSWSSLRSSNGLFSCTCRLLRRPFKDFFRFKKARGLGRAATPGERMRF